MVMVGDISRGGKYQYIDSKAILIKAIVLEKYYFNDLVCLPLYGMSIQHVIVIFHSLFSHNSMYEYSHIFFQV